MKHKYLFSFFIICSFNMIQLSCNNKMDPKRKGKSNISNKSNICSININALQILFQEKLKIIL